MIPLNRDWLEPVDAAKWPMYSDCGSLTLIRTVFLRYLIGTYVDICQHAVFMCFSMLMGGVFKYYFVFL